MPEKTTDVGLRTCLAYAIPAFPLALFGITFYVYLPKFYADHLGVGLGVMGAIVLVSRMFDAVLDPLVGAWSDRTRHRLGRRRSWMALAILPLALVFLGLAWPGLRGALPEAWWFGAGVFAFFIFWTAFTVPFESLGPELTFDYDKRTRLLGFREGAVVLGTVFAAIIPFALQTRFPEWTQERVFATVGVTYGITFVLAGIICLVAVRERIFVENPRPTGTWREGMHEVLANRPFRILLTAYTVGALGGALPATLILFYVEDVLGSANGSAFLILYFLVGFICLPIWVKIAARIGKKEAWVCALAVNTGAFAGVLFLGHGDELAYGILVALSAVGYGATLALPASMQADVIDLDEKNHGGRREGAFIGLWSIAKKLAAAFGAGVAFPILAIFGYETGSTEQTPRALTALAVLYAGVPCACNAAAMAIAWRYPITRDDHLAIRAELDARSPA